MVVEKSPAFQFYAKEFLSDANQAGMSLLETGAYARLMCFEWNEQGKGLPDDQVRCGRMVGATLGQMRTMWPTLRACFIDHPTVTGRMVHPRLQKERVKQAEFRRRQSDKGKASAASRRAAGPQPESNHGSTSALPGVNSPVSISTLQEEHKAAAAPRTALAMAPNANGNYRVIEALACELRKAGFWEVGEGVRFEIQSEAELVHAVKDVCAQKRITYSSDPDVAVDTVHRACASAWAQFEKRAARA